MMTTDLRADLRKITTPTLVLGAWAAYTAYGADQETTRMTLVTQYEQLKDVEIRMSGDGFHFLTWDDPEWVNQEIARFISSHSQ